jgi:type I restriction enzyme S subunit
VSWPSVTLGDVSVHIRNGASIKQSSDAKGLPITRIETIAAREINLKKCGYADVGENDFLGHRLDAGDILISHINSEKHLGKCAIYEGTRKDIVHGMNLLCLRPKQEIIFPRFLFHYLSSSVFLQMIPEITKKSVNQASFTVTAFKFLEISLPPLTEQKRIAAILDKADAIRRKRQQAIQLADDFLRAVFLDMFGDPVINPKGWEQKNLKDIARIQIGPFGTQLHKEDYITDGVPLINPSHIINSKIVPKRNLTVKADKCNDLPQYKLELDDIILGRRGEMGRAAIVSEKEIGWLCGTGSLFIRTTQKGAFAFYLHKFLTSDYMKNHLISESLGATMPNLNKTIVGNIQIPIPSEEALLKFQKILNVNKQLRVRMGGADKNLFVSLSQKAFVGEL